MTEEEWRTCSKPEAMLQFVSHQLSERIVRRFALLACRAGPTLSAYDGLEQACETAEQSLDGVVPPDEWAGALSEVERCMWEMCESLNHLATAVNVAFRPSPSPIAAAELVTNSIVATYPLSGCEGRENEGYEAQCAFLRELIPFRPVEFSAAWRSDTAVSLARGMYESRDFGAMPILADALQDAGCDSDDVLSHCRDATATHVRGCWVVGLVLGKG